MNNIVKKIFAGLLIFAVVTGTLLYGNVDNVYAGSANVTISSASCTVGDEVAVTVTISSAEVIYMCDFYLTYDSSILEPVSGHSAGGGGTVRVLSTDQTGKTVKFTITFKAKKAGTSKLVINDDGNTTIASEVTDKLALSVASGSVTAKAPVTYSSENNLASLSVSPGSLSPAFSAGTTSYTVSVPADCDKLVVSAKAKDSKATVNISGTSLKVGTNTTTITVTAENGSKKVYTIKTTRPQGATQVQTQQQQTQSVEQNTSSETIANTNLTVKVNDAEYEIYDNFTENPLPAGFEESAYEYNNNSIKVGKNSKNNLIVMYLVAADEKGKSGFYIYDSVSKKFTQYTQVNLPDISYIILPITEQMEKPDGYNLTEATIADNKVSVLKGTSDDYCLFYGTNSNGVTGWYMYEYTDKTIQRYIAFEEIAKGETESQSSEYVAGSNVANNSDNEKLWQLVAIVMTIIAVVMSIIAFVFIRKASKHQNINEIELDDIEDKSLAPRPDAINDEELPEEDDDTSYGDILPDDYEEADEEDDKLFDDVSESVEDIAVPTHSDAIETIEIAEVEDLDLVESKVEEIDVEEVESTEDVDSVEEVESAGDVDSIEEVEGTEKVENVEEVEIMEIQLTEVDDDKEDK